MPLFNLIPWYIIYIKFLGEIHEELGTQITVSIIFYPQTDGMSERMIQVLEDMLRICAIDFEGHRDKFLSICEFSYNSSYYSSIYIKLFEILYRRRCRSPIGWSEVGDVKPLGVDLIKDDRNKVRRIQVKLLIAQSQQKEYVDHKVKDMTF